jgi:hypothetical protein
MPSDKPAGGGATGWSQTGWKDMPSGPYNPISPGGYGGSSGGGVTGGGNTGTSQPTEVEVKVEKPESEYYDPEKKAAVSVDTSKTKGVFGAPGEAGGENWQKVTQRVEAENIMVLQTEQTGISGGGSIVAMPALKSPVGSVVTQDMQDLVLATTIYMPMGKPVGEPPAGVVQITKEQEETFKASLPTSIRQRYETGEIIKIEGMMFARQLFKPPEIVEITNPMRIEPKKAESGTPYFTRTDIGTRQDILGFPIFEMPQATLTVAPSIFTERRATQARLFEGARPEVVFAQIPFTIGSVLVGTAMSVKTITWDVPIGFLSDPLGYPGRVYGYWSGEAIPRLVYEGGLAIERTRTFSWSAAEVTGTVTRIGASYAVGKYLISPITKPIISTLTKPFMKTSTEAEQTGFIYKEEVIPEGVKYTSTIVSEAESRAYFDIFGGRMPVSSAVARLEGTQESLVYSTPQVLEGVPTNVIGTTYGTLTMGKITASFVDTGRVSFINIEAGATLSEYDILPYKITYGESGITQLIIQPTITGKTTYEGIYTTGIIKYHQSLTPTQASFMYENVDLFEGMLKQTNEIGVEVGGKIYEGKFTTYNIGYVMDEGGQAVNIGKGIGTAVHVHPPIGEYYYLPSARDVRIGSGYIVSQEGVAFYTPKGEVIFTTFENIKQPLITGGEKLGVTASWSQTGGAQATSTGGLLQELSRTQLPYGEVIIYKHAAVSGTGGVIYSNIRILDITGQASSAGGAGVTGVSVGGGMVQQQIFGDMGKLGFSVAKTSELSAMANAQANIGTAIGTTTIFASSAIPQAKTETKALTLSASSIKMEDLSRVSMVEKTSEVEMTKQATLTKQTQLMREVTGQPTMEQIMIKQMPVSSTPELTKQTPLTKETQITNTLTKTLQLSPQLTKISQMTRQVTPELTKTPMITITTKTEWPPIFPPIFGGGGGDILGNIRSRIFGRQPLRYTPSLTAAVFNIRGSIDIGKMFTGLEIRPLKIKWR